MTNEMTPNKLQLGDIVECTHDTFLRGKRGRITTLRVGRRYRVVSQHRDLGGTTITQIGGSQSVAIVWRLLAQNFSYLGYDGLESMAGENRITDEYSPMLGSPAY